MTCRCDETVHTLLKKPSFLFGSDVSLSLSLAYVSFLSLSLSELIWYLSRLLA